MAPTKKLKGEQESKAQKIWLDCDPGHDDSIAILLAAFGQSPENQGLQLLGISTVHGNATVENTTNNALKMVTVFDIDVEVVTGQSKPLFRDSQICPEIHGDSGLDLKCVDNEPVFKWPLLKKPLDKKAVLHMYDVISQQEPGEVVLVITGCQTNVALLFTLFPEVKKFIQKIVILGGAIGVGNMTPAAEFNILIDPEAASLVLESGLPIYLITIETSHQALVTKEFLARIKSLNSEYANLLTQLMTFFGETYRTVFGFNDPPLHDPLTIAYLLDPSIFEFKHMRVDIECKSELTKGATLCDTYGMSSLPKNCYVCTKCDIPAFWELVFDAFQRANRAALNKDKNKN